MTVEVTIVMVPRERYSAIITSIKSVYENTKIPFKLIVVDGGLPAVIKNEIEEQSELHGFEFIYKPYPLKPNEARNIGLIHVDTEYVVFCDDDIIFTPNWLNTLVHTAKEYDAWLVGPTILDGNPEDGQVHATAGTSGFDEIKGKRYYHFVPGNIGKYLSDNIELRRGPTTMLEFHVILCATHIFEKIGSLDEQISSFGDHDDFVRNVQIANGSVIFEPNSIVSFHDPGTNMSVIEKTDLPFFLLRWSDEWNFGSVDRAAKKWGLADDCHWISHAKHWVQLRRRKSYYIAGIQGRIIGFILYKISASLGQKLESIFYKKHTQKLQTLRMKYLGHV